MKRVWNKKLHAFVDVKTEVNKDGTPKKSNKKTNLPNAGGTIEPESAPAVDGGVSE